MCWINYKRSIGREKIEWYQGNSNDNRMIIYGVKSFFVLTHFGLRMSLFVLGIIKNNSLFDQGENAIYSECEELIKNLLILELKNVSYAIENTYTRYKHAPIYLDLSLYHNIQEQELLMTTTIIKASTTVFAV
jgi:hypothetical protein